MEASSSFSLSDSLLSAVYSPYSVYKRYTDGLAFPGSNEAFGRETKGVLAANHLFDGAKIDLSKTISMAPLFQLNHSFTLGSQSPMASKEGSYSFVAVVHKENTLLSKDAVLMQGNIDGSGMLYGQLKYDWASSGQVTKLVAQLPPRGGMQMMPSMFSIDHDIVGDSAAVTFQVVNPSLATSSAAFSTTFLQAITRNLSIGGGLISPMKNGQFGEIGGQLRAKYSRLQSPLTSSVNDWMVTTEAALDGSGVNAGYWQKLDSQVEAGAELDTRISPQSGKRETLASVGLKYEFRTSLYRAQVDSTGKIAAHLTQQLNPMMAFIVSGEIDQWKNTSRFGIGLQLETTNMDELNAMQAKAQEAKA